MQNDLKKATLQEALLKTRINSIGPNMKKKAIFMRDMYFYDFALLAPVNNTIGSRYNQSESKSISLAEVSTIIEIYILVGHTF